jgi:lipase maturation factor 1
VEGHPQGGEAPQAADLRATRRLFLRLLAVVYLCAFVSLAVQIEGLVGSRGILPAAELLDWVRGQVGAERYFLLPTLAWLSASDGFLRFLCWGGAGLAVLLFAGIAPLPVLALLWAFYLSIVGVGQVFLGYQWDGLLLEAGLLALLLAPPVWRSRRETDPGPPWYSVWVLRWLLARLMFASGVVKLRSGDAAWRHLTALQFHYETQPLPTWIGWYAHQMPAWFQTLSAALMFGVELGAPLLMFAGRRGRLAAAASLAVLQLLIAATGNYGFFNLLTLALCVMLLDDAVLPRRWRGTSRPTPSPRWFRHGGLAFGAALFGLSIVVFTESVGLPVAWPKAVLDVQAAAAPFSSVNSYGLFAVMTTSRPEIVVEGSNDGVTWKPYRFRWKAGDLEGRPAFVAPHQPRLDWQMWFAALGTCDRNPWFVRFVGRLLEGSPPVLGLLESNPFPDVPPKMIRTTLYDYRFTRFGEPAARTHWWRRRRIGPYCPIIESP